MIAIAAGLLVFGILQLSQTPMDILPEFTRPTVEVQTEALGLSAEEVEQLITVPLEQDLLNGVAFLDDIESVSLPGLSSVVLTFEPGTDLLDARQVVEERLTQAVGVAGLPQVSQPPQMIQPLSSTSRVSMIKLSSRELSPIELSVLARWVIVPRLVGVDGVANVAIWGFRDRQLQVQVDPERLATESISLNQVIRTAGNALEVSPLTFLEASSPGTGGFIDTLNQRLHVFHQQAISTPLELGQVTVEDVDGGAVFRRGRPVALGDVTEIVEDHQPLIGDALCSDGPCILLIVEKFPNANTPKVTQQIDAALETLRPGLSGVQIDTSVYRPAAFIGQSFANLSRVLLIGAILLVLVLVACLRSWRGAVVAAVVIPLSLVAAGLVLYLRGVTVHTMTLAGLVMALAALIDDAVVGVDGALQRVRAARAAQADTPMWRAVIAASVEIRSGMLYAALLVVVVLVPVLLLRGEAGAFLPPIAATYLLAIVASMLVALTVTPALTMMLVGNAPLDGREPLALRWLHRGHDRTAPTVARPVVALVAFAIALVIGLATLPFLDLSLRPALGERDLLVSLEAPPGTSLPRMDEIAAQTVDGLRAVAGISNVVAHVGRAISSDQIVNVNSAEVWVNIDASADYQATVAAIERVAADTSGATSKVLTYSEQRISDVLQGSDDQLVVRLYGQDRQLLASKAAEVEGVLSTIDGIDRPQAQLPAEEPTLEVEVDLARAQAVGLKAGDVRRAAATLLGGIVVGNLFEDQRVFDVVVWGAPELRQNPDVVRAMLIDAPGGRRVRLDEVADVRVVPNPSAIRHESVERYVDVTAAVAGRNAGDVARDVRSALEQVEFPFEHHAELLGGYAEQQASRTRMVAVAFAAAIGVLLLLQAAFGSWRLALALFLALPMALAGGLVASRIDGPTLTLGSVAGLIAVLGIAASNGILLIRNYQRLERREGLPFGPELVERGTRERVGPILLTAIATIAALAPVLFAGHAAGLEIVRPLAVSVLGGLMTSALLNLVVVPAAYGRFGYVAEPDLAGDDLFGARDLDERIGVSSDAP